MCLEFFLSILSQKQIENKFLNKKTLKLDFSMIIDSSKMGQHMTTSIGIKDIIYIIIF
jgi:hypothetical protein